MAKWYIVIGVSSIIDTQTHGDTRFTLPLSVSVGDLAWDGDNIWVTNGGSKNGVVTRVNVASVLNE